MNDLENYLLNALLKAWKDNSRTAFVNFFVGWVGGGIFALVLLWWMTQ